MHQTRYVMAFTAIGSVVLLATACGTAGSGASGADQASVKAGVTAAAQRLAAYSAKPTFDAPGRPFDARAVMKGKKVLSVPASSSNPFDKAIIKPQQDVARTVGFEYDVWENLGQTSQWVQGVQRGISSAASVIDLLGGTSSKLLGPQIAAAQGKGIKVTDSAINGITGQGGVERSPNVDFTNGLPYRLAGELMASWVVKDSGGKANVLVITSNDATSSPIVEGGVADTLKKDCPACKVKKVNVPLADWSTKITPAVQAALAQNPGLDYIIPQFDSESPYVISALQIARKSKDVKIATFNGTPDILNLVRQGKVAMDVSQDLGWAAYSMMDNIMRLTGGLEPIADQKVPLQVVTKDNVDGFNHNAYLAGYSKLWGLK